MLVTHDLDEAARLADRLAVPDRGKLSQVGARSEVAVAPVSQPVRDGLDLPTTGGPELKIEPAVDPTAPEAPVPDSVGRRAGAFGGGGLIGALGGLIGLGGAEFRLPLLIGAFRFGALEAVILNKAMSLIVVMSALPFRARTVPFEAVGAQWPVILNLLAGSLAGAWLGAGWAVRLRSQTVPWQLTGVHPIDSGLGLAGRGAWPASRRASVQVARWRPGSPQRAKAAW